jgi:hypothetical protein
MTTIVTIHGTFAHVVGNKASLLDPDAPAAVSTPWWQEDSAFAKLVSELSPAEDRPVKVEPFEWSGLNSEAARRAAGSALLAKLRDLEARGETYSVVAHSHGGSVVSWALLEAARRKIDLAGLHKWVTVGTPFVELRPERLLFFRLPILLKAVFVASLMLLFMFLFYGISEYLSRVWLSETRLGIQGRLGPLRFLIAALLASLPFLVFYAGSKLWDSRRLYFYRRGVIQRARERFGGKWIGLCHENDEAVHGLGSLRNMSVPIFDRRFAVPVLSLLSVFILPVAYLYTVSSPNLMIGIAQFLKNRVYAIEDFERMEQAFDIDQGELRSLRRQIRRARRQQDEAERLSDVTRRLSVESELKALIERRRALRESLDAKYPQYVEFQRAERFAERFLRRDGKPCADTRLCDGGRNLALNSKLLFHLITDEASSWLVDEDLRWSTYGTLVRYAVPIILVPIVFGIAAMAMVMLVQWLAVRFSATMSRILDRMTWKQVRRSALGNDTGSEVAIAAMSCPPWLDTQPRYLAPELRDIITEHSNHAMIESLGKIRNAIRDLAFADGGGQGDVAAAVLGYLNWKELIHTTYFEVPEFRAFVAHVIADGNESTNGAAIVAFLDQATAERWLAALRATSDDSDVARDVARDVA